MIDFFSSKFFDNLILYSFLGFLSLSFIVDAIKFIKNIAFTISENSNSISIKMLLSSLIILFIIPISICLIFYNYIKTLPYFNIIISCILIIFVIIFLYKAINTINKISFKKESFAKNDKYNIIFSELLYFVFFSSSIYNFFIESFENINNIFIFDLTTTIYVTLKIIIIFFYTITNVLFILEIFYKLFGEKIFILLNKTYKKIYNYELEINFDKNNITIVIENQSKKFIKYFFSKINQLHIIFKLPFIFIIFYFIEFIKFILSIFLKFFLFPLKWLKRIYNQENIFFYNLFRIIICLTISITYFYILLSNNYCDNSIKYFEFLGITLIITSFLPQIIKQKRKK